MKSDKLTMEWLGDHPGIETTMCVCEKCGKAYKPALGHRCEEDEE